jgi:hypothetical protein
MNFFNTLLEFISYFNSPFIKPKLKFYIGEIAIGTPYFFPRKAIKDPDKPGYLKFIPKKIGFDIVKLGWKTKWSEYRFEWSPVISFVFFKWQFAVTIVAPEQHQYWESWLYWKYKTDKKSNWKDRAHQCQKEYLQNWVTIQNGNKKEINYYNLILRKKYILKNIDEIREDKLNSILD